MWISEGPQEWLPHKQQKCLWKRLQTSSQSIFRTWLENSWCVKLHRSTMGDTLHCKRGTLSNDLWTVNFDTIKSKERALRTSGNRARSSQWRKSEMMTVNCYCRLAQNHDYWWSDEDNHRADKDWADKPPYMPFQPWMWTPFTTIMGSWMITWSLPVRSSCYSTFHKVEACSWPPFIRSEGSWCTGASLSGS